MKKALSVILALTTLLFVGCSKEIKNEEPIQEETFQEDASQKEQTPDWMTLPADRTLTAQQYFVYDCENGEFLKISGKPEEKIYPASITKVFTAYVAGQFLNTAQEITVGASLDLVYPGSSVAELQKGDKVTVARLVEAMMLPSGNDAAYVLAVEAGRCLSGPSATTQDAVAAFVEEMNRQAKILGMRNTHFANPDGIHQDSHYSSFHDLAIMGTLALEDPVLMQYAGTAGDTVTLTGGQKQWKNTNALIQPESQYYCPYAVGLKTGQTPSAGSCLLSAFEYKGRSLVVGVFGCPEVEDRFADTLQLFNETIGYTG